jgi:tRNA nucleotidyltransferase (CCA-adding enzyme)
MLDRVSGDRLRHEMNSILLEKNALPMLQRLADLDVLTAIHPALIFDSKTSKRLQLAHSSQPEAEWELEEVIERYPLGLALSYILWLMPLKRVDAASAAGRLKLPGWLTKVLLAACNPLSAAPELRSGTPSQVAGILEDVPILALYAHYITAKNKKARHALLSYVSEWRHIQPVTTGHDLRARQIPPGPVYRQILDNLRAAWLDGKVKTEQEEQALLEELLHG